MSENAYAVVTSQNGIGGWVFDIPTDTRLQFESDISSHVMEDNSTITDHVVNKPRTMTFRGYVGELVSDNKKPTGDTPLMESRLTELDALSPELSAQATQTANTLISSKAASIRESSVVDSSPVSSWSTGARQREVLETLTNLWKNKAIVSVITPWERIETCMIESIGFTQNDTTLYATDVEITVKEVRFAKMKTTIAEREVLDTYAMQNSSQSDRGNVQGVEIDDRTTLMKIVNAFNRGIS